MTHSSNRGILATSLACGLAQWKAVRPILDGHSQNKALHNINRIGTIIPATSAGIPTIIKSSIKWLLTGKLVDRMGCKYHSHERFLQCWTELLACPRIGGRKVSSFKGNPSIPTAGFFLSAMEWLELREKISYFFFIRRVGPRPLLCHFYNLNAQWNLDFTSTL